LRNEELIIFISYEKDLGAVTVNAFDTGHGCTKR
jgi:hypothetical protein